MDEKKLWKEVLGLVRLSVSPPNFSTWIAQTFILSVKKLDSGRQVVEVGCPSSFIADAVEKRYFGLVQDSLNQITGLKNDLVFSVRQVPSARKPQEAPLFYQLAGEQGDSSLDNSLRRAGASSGSTFENFAVSGTNQMAWAAADAVSRELGGAYNPLFIWGGVGVGKTHLMLAIAHRALTGSPDEKVMYCTGEEFTNEIVDAIRNKTTNLFKKKYRALRLLMVDDIQFISGKVAVQEEFFHTFNAVLRARGQIVLTSDVPPTDIPRLESRLRSRFEAGLIIDIAPPDFELRAAITLIKAKEKDINLSMPAAQAIAANIDSPRKIKGFLVRLISESRSLGKEITDDLVNALLNKTNGDIKPNRVIHPNEFISAVSTYYSLGKRRLLGVNRAQTIALPRQVLMYLLRRELDLPLQEVGRIIGGRDHTTIIHGVDKISVNLSTNQKLREDILRIKQLVWG